ncbi:MAG: Ig-like domain-containing protein [Sphaerobacter sp.]|nr:Ig-like domain-containing protein [Sphaerobacter sp.]
MSGPRRDVRSSAGGPTRLARLLAALLLLAMAALPPAASANDATPTPTPTLKVTVTPESQTLEIGRKATFTASVTDVTNSTTPKPVEGATVSYTVTDGPNTKRTGSATTGADGKATLTTDWSGASPGTDKVEFKATKEGMTEAVAFTVTVTWVKVDELTVTPAKSFGIAGKSVTLTATALDSTDKALVGVDLKSQVTAGPNKSQTITTVPTDEDGKATFTYTGSSTTGTDTVEVTTAGTSGKKATAQVVWLRGPVKITLSPKTSTGTLALPHTLTATVTDGLGNEVAGATVRFTVTGQNQVSKDVTTDADGEATFTYTSTRTGTDTVTAYVDLNLDGDRDSPDEPQTTATITWAGRGELTLSPSENTLALGQSQPLTATLTDATGAPLPNITVRFTITGANPGTWTIKTNNAGVATITYTGQNLGIDILSAYADLNANGSLNTSEPSTLATITWVRPATLSLAASDASPESGQAVAITATLTDSAGAVAGVPVRFSVSGVHAQSFVRASDIAGTAVFTYTGANAGTDTVSAYADFNGNGVQDTGEPAVSLTITWRTPRPPFTPGQAASPKPGCVYFPQTQHNLCGGFLSYWERFGGLAVYGYPLTEEFVENGVTTQYFERARFEWHPGSWPERFDVLLGLLGNDVTADRRSETPFQRAQDKPGCVYFPATGHNLCGGFLSYWQAYGGLAVYGMPISEEFREVNPDTGVEYTVQYFERQRFEWHPGEWPERFDVMLGRVGAQILAVRYPQR